MYYIIYQQNYCIRNVFKRRKSWKNYQKSFNSSSHNKNLLLVGMNLSTKKEIHKPVCKKLL